MHIVITRPEEDSLFLIERLKTLGHVITHLPVIKVEKLKTETSSIVPTFWTVLFKVAKPPIQCAQSAIILIFFFDNYFI